MELNHKLKVLLLIFLLIIIVNSFVCVCASTSSNCTKFNHKFNANCQNFNIFNKHKYFNNEHKLSGK